MGGAEEEPRGRAARGWALPPPLARGARLPPPQKGGGSSERPPPPPRSFAMRISARGALAAAALAAVAAGASAQSPWAYASDSTLLDVLANPGPLMYNIIYNLARDVAGGTLGLSA